MIRLTRKSKLIGHPLEEGFDNTTPKQSTLDGKDGYTGNLTIGIGNTVGDAVIKC